MNVLEKRVPPPVVTSIAAISIFLLARTQAPMAVPKATLAALTGLCVFLALLLIIPSLLAFYRARTTLNPLHPEKTCRLVTSGLYRVSRNPMYLGLAFMLMAWSIHLAFWQGLFIVVIFIAYIQRFQIVPEERALLAKFGEEFERYKTQVRPWL